MKSFLLASFTLSLLSGMTNAQQFWPTVTTTTNMGTFSSYNIQNLTNGSGLSSMTLAGTHSATWQEMWISNAITTGWVEFDLGSIQPLHTIAMWNYNSSISTARGVAQMDVYTSLNGSQYTLLSRETPPRGTAQPLPAHLIRAGGVPARYVKFDILQNYGNNYTGMSEVQFVVSTLRLPHGCGPTTITISGQPRIGGTITTSLGAVVGVPVIGFGFSFANVPFCGCTVGHDWVFPFTTGSLPLPIPNDVRLIGGRIGIQGADVLGAGGCPAPKLTLTDTILVTIG